MNQIGIEHLDLLAYVRGVMRRDAMKEAPTMSEITK
jgi:hypothetical protein